MRQKVERDLEVLIGEEWLSDDTRDVDTRARTEWQHSPLFVAVEESRTLGLDVEVTGDPAAVARLDPAERPRSDLPRSSASSTCSSTRESTGPTSSSSALTPT